MFIRFVHVSVKPEHVVDIRNLYESTVVPTLQKVSGCLFAGLIRNEHKPEEFTSMTLWKSGEQAVAYEQGPVYKELLEVSRQYLADSTEWRIQLTKDLELEYAPVPQEPVINTFEVKAEKEGSAMRSSYFPSMYVRIVSVQLQEGKMEEFREVYEHEILPVLREVRGCHYVFLTEGSSDRNEVISITVWDSKQDADAYESSGLFNELTERIQHTLSEIYQWKMNLQRQGGKQVVTTADVNVQSFSGVVGKSFAL